MHQEKYTLTWNAYSDHLRNMMREMLNDDFTDVTLVSEDRKYIKDTRIFSVPVAQFSKIL